MVDRLLVTRKLSELEEYLGQVREFSPITQETYKKDWKMQRIVRKNPPAND